MSEDYKTVNNIECDCPCDYETALYFAQCATRPDQDPDNPDLKLKFIPSTSSSSPEPVGLADTAKDVIVKTLKDSVTKEGKDLANMFVNAAAQYLADTASQATRETGRKIFDVVKPPSSGGRGNGGKGGNNDNPNSSNYRGSSFGLSYDAKPVEMRLNTGIKPKTYTSIYEDAVDLFSSPLHLTLVKFAIPSSTQAVDTYFSKVISFIFTNALQQAISFNLDTTLFTAAKLRTALNSLINALNVYYFYNSILTYSQNSQNRNEGMLGVRTSLTATNLSDLLNLKRVLAGCPIPPNFISFFFYLNQTFQQTNVPGGPLYKICPVTWDDTNNTPYATDIVSAMDDLESADNRFIFGHLARCCPNWLGQNLPDISWTPVYDPNFNTIWANLPGYYYNGSTYYRSPEVTTSNPNAKYVSFTNELDGAAFCLTSLFNSSTTAWSPTFVVPHYKTYNTNNRTNRLYWSYGGVWSDACTSLVHTLQRNEVYQVNTNYVGVKAAAHLAGSQICQQVNYSTISETTLSLLDYLMSMETIGRLIDNRDYIGKAYFEMKPAPKGGKGKSNSKGKGKSKS